MEKSSEKDKAFAEKVARSLAKNKDVAELYKKLQNKNNELRKENQELRKKNQRLLREQKRILEDSDKMLFYLRGMQRRMEEWNRQDGDFFDGIMPAVQMLYGYFSAGDKEKVKETLKNLRNQIRSSWRMLRKDKGSLPERKTEKQLRAKDLHDALQRLEEDKKSYEDTVLYQNLLLPLLCILEEDAASNPDRMWEREADEIFRKEGLRTLYCGELPSDDAVNRSQFARIKEGTETPGLFRIKGEQEYELFGNYQGRVRK